MLLKWGAEEADRLGLDSYLESSPEGKSLYEKYGFQVGDVCGRLAEMGWPPGPSFGLDAPSGAEIYVRMPVNVECEAVD